MGPQELAERIAAAKARLAVKGVAVVAPPNKVAVIPTVEQAAADATAAKKPRWTWNAAQTAVTNSFGVDPLTSCPATYKPSATQTPSRKVWAMANL